MNRLITITLNPAYDIHCSLEEICLNGENYAIDKQVSIGGKGINVSRALNSLGVKSGAVCILGDKNKGDFLRLALKENLGLLPITVSGNIRENLTFHTIKNGKETRISFEGFETDPNVLGKIKELIKADKDTVVAFCGRLPKGIDNKTAIAFLKDIKASGAFLAVDCNSFSMDDLFEIMPDLIKPNETEAQAVIKDNNYLQAAKQINQKGIKNVLISLGKDGGVYASNNFCAKISVPKIEVVSTIGAGDSTIAGFLYGLIKGINKQDIIKFAFACGSAACLTLGTTPPQKEEVLKILDDIKIDKA